MGILLLCFNPSIQAEIDSLLLQKSENYPIEVRTFEEDKLQNHLDNPSFYYDRPPPKPSLLQQFFTWLSRNEDSNVVKSFDFLWRYGKYLLTVLVLIYVIQQLLNANFVTLFMKKPKQQGIGYQVMDENIHELNFDQLIAEATGKQHFRRAVRLCYLKSLKSMTDKDLINWRPYKTNYDYQLELNKTPFGQSFSELTYLFDHVWYGNFELSEDLFGDAKRQFLEFEQLID